jgi:hypothetical protein
MEFCLNGLEFGNSIMSTMDKGIHGKADIDQRNGAALETPWYL